MYTSGDLQNKYGITRQTVTNWVVSFAEFLSPSGNPPPGSRRRFTDDDMRVFEMVAACKKRGMNTDEIVATLASGQRGQLPEPEDFLPSAPSGAMLALQNRITMLEQLIVEMRSERDRTAGQNMLLQQQLEAAQQEIIRLNIELSKSR